MIRRGRWDWWTRWVLAGLAGAVLEGYVWSVTGSGRVVLVVFAGLVLLGGLTYYEGRVTESWSLRQRAADLAADERTALTSAQESLAAALAEQYRLEAALRAAGTLGVLGSDGRVRPELIEQDGAGQ